MTLSVLESRPQIFRELEHYIAKDLYDLVAKMTIESGKAINKIEPFVMDYESTIIHLALCRTYNDYQKIVDIKDAHQCKALCR
jgi:hypothetical protein